MKLGWRLDFWKPEGADKSPVVKELEKEIKADKAARKTFLALVETLEELGPHDFISSRNKALGKGLYELRDMTAGKRYYYTETKFTGTDGNQEEKVILLLGAVGSKNTASGQNRDIEKARERLKSIEIENISSSESIRIKEYK